jgi:membrane protease YdiL (CAAX protease family)
MSMIITLQVIDAALVIAGGLCCSGVIVWWVRTGRWRNPLAGAALPTGGPTLAGVGAIVLTYLALLALATNMVSLVQPASAALSAPSPGSAAWHWALLVEQVVGLLVAVGMAVMLARARAAQPPGPRLGRAASLAAATVGWLVLLPLTSMQDEMGRVVWRWLYPQAPPPLHAVLLALGHSVWGVWGTVQLLVGAVLIAPLVEELFFRGLLLQALCYHFRGGWVAVAASAVAFGGVHAQPQDILPLVTMGAVLGYLRLRSGVLWPCILLHALFNARTMVVVILAPDLLPDG